MKNMNILFRKIPGYKHGCVRNRVFMTSQKQNMTELAATIYLVNRMSKVGLELKFNVKSTF